MPMSKRKPGGFRRIERNLYPTSLAQAERLLPFLWPGARFYEPCAGAGDLVRHLVARGMVCVGASDIEPRGEKIGKRDALTLWRPDLENADLIITNPAHEGVQTVFIIDHLRKLKPSWMLLPLDYLANDYMQQLLGYASIITPAKRLRLAGTPDQGTDNFVWVRFEELMPRKTAFISAFHAANGTVRA
jgi:hypothetical protein